MTAQDGWIGIHADDGLSHVVPQNDLYPHDTQHELDPDGTLSLRCWCAPTYDEGVIVHHSADGREESKH